MATSTEHTGAMIALVPSDDDLVRLKIDRDGAEPANELHLTLFYLGDAVDIPPAKQQQLATAIGNAVEDRGLGAVTAHAFGVAHWNPASDDPAWVLNVGDDEDELSVTRELIAEVMQSVEFSPPTQHTPWQPHICLAYAGDDWSDEGRRRLGDVTFDRVRLAFGGDVTDVPLRRAATVASTSGGSIVPWHTVHNHAECSDGKPWAVVKDADGSVAGCHETEAAANEQLAALYASEPEAVVTTS